MAEDEDIRRARQARELAKKLAEQKTDPLAELQASIAASKELAKKKNIEIPTIAFEQAINTGDSDAARDAALAIAKAQGLKSSAATQSATNLLQENTPKPTLTEAQIARGDRIVWQGGLNGYWQVIMGKNVTTTNSSSQGDNLGSGTIFRFINGILYANGSPFTGNYQGKKYQDGKALDQFNNGDGTTGRTYTAPDGTIFTDLNAYNAYIAQTKQTVEKAARQSAYDLLFQQFDAYGLGGLVTPLRELIESGINPAEFTIRLRATDAYKKRFAANQARVAKGLRALSEAEYIGLEDQYQDVMRRYGLPQEYYSRGEMGRQEGFEKFIGGDVSPVELEDRIQTAQRRVLNAAPQVKDALAQFYGAEIGNGDILAYVLDPEKAIENIKRKVTAAEIGAGAMQAGLATGLSRAEELQRYGVTGEQARTGYQTIASYLPRASTLADIYAKQGMGPFTQTTAEAEVFGTPGGVEAAQKRRKITELEQAQFGGTSGVTGGALARERAGQF